MSNPASPNSIQLYIGIDGGGTSCRARIEETEGNVLGQGTSDEGSGADLGLQAVRLALRAQDSRISPTPFLLEVIGKFGSDPVALVAEQATATEYASLAPVALAYAEAGDPFAEEIVAEGARQADGLIRSLVEFGALPVSLLGALASRMVQWLAVAGPLLLARRKGSVPIASSGQRKGAQIC